MAKDDYAGIELLYMLPVMPGEHIVGYINTCMHAGGHVRMKDLAKTLVDRQTIEPPWSLPSNLRRLAEHLAPALVSGEQILRDHTCLSAYLPFATKSRQQLLLAHALDGVRSKGLAGAIGLTGNFIETKPKLAICPSCVREDDLSHGRAYWRRAHTLPGVTFCAQHSRALLVGCGKCRFSQLKSREPLLPRKSCWCGGDLVELTPRVSAQDRDVLLRAAGYAERLLGGQLAGRHAGDLGTYYHYCAARAGFQAGTSIRSTLLTQALEEQYSTRVLSLLNARLGDRWKWPSTTFGKGIAPSVLGRNLLLFDFFGQRVPNADDFVTSEEHMLRTNAKRKRASVPSGTPEDILADRRTIEAFIHENPGATRNEALRALGRTMTRARARDSQWYDATIPAKPRGGRPNTLAEQKSYLCSLDKKAAEHVARRTKLLLNIEGGFPMTITKQVLLKGLPRANEITKQFLLRLPRTAALITKSVETRSQFQRRFALAILRREDLGSLDARFREATRRTGLRAPTLEELNFSLTKESEWNHLSQSTAS